MPQVKTSASTKSRKKTDPNEVVSKRPSRADAYDLIAKMMEYEDAAKARGMDFAASRFRMLTTAERDFCRAELIADYIRLSVGNMGNTPGYFDAALDSYCVKICDMAIPSHELIGTYLASIDIVTKDENINKSPELEAAVRGTMGAVLQMCVTKLGEKSLPIGI